MAITTPAPLPARRWSCRDGATAITVHVATDATLRERRTLWRLARAVRRLKISRYDVPDWLADVIYGFDGSIRWPDGRPFPVPDTYVDDLFDDVYCRWCSDFMRFAEHPPRQAPQARVLDRLRAIDLSLTIAAADPACGR